MANVLVIGDLHLPAERADYLKFCRAMKRKHKTTKTIFIGDILDHHAISFHQKNPDSDGAVEEYTKAMKALRQWYKAFPEAFPKVKITTEAKIPGAKAEKDFKEVHPKTLEQLLDALALKPAKSKFLKNLNESKNLLVRNEKLIRLKKHNEICIKAGKYGDEAWEELRGVAT